MMPVVVVVVVVVVVEEEELAEADNEDERIRDEREGR